MRVAGEANLTARSSARAKMESLSVESPAPSAKLITCSSRTGKVRQGNESARTRALASYASRPGNSFP